MKVASIAEEPTVFVVDDDGSVRKAIRRLMMAVGMRVETYASAGEFLAHLDPSGPACLLLDVYMPGVTGLELQRKLVAKGLDIPIVFITARGDVRTSVEAMKAGATDFIQKPFSEADLLEAVNRAIERDVEGSRRRKHRVEIQERVATLTPREREVFSLVVTGLLNKQIGATLGASEKTIKVHRARVMRKLGAESVADLVRFAHVVGVTDAEV